MVTLLLSQGAHINAEDKKEVRNLFLFVLYSDGMGMYKPQAHHMLVFVTPCSVRAIPVAMFFYRVFG